MVKHKQVYLEGSGYSEGDYIPCEVCESTAVDIHHIEARGMGGTKRTEEFGNLMALCRKCHNEYGDITDLKDMLKQIHYRRFDKIFNHLIIEKNGNIEIPDNMVIISSEIIEDGQRLLPMPEVKNMGYKCYGINILKSDK